MRRTFTFILPRLSVAWLVCISTSNANETKSDVNSEIHGKWQLISIVLSGVPVPEMEIKDTQMIFSKDSYKVVIGGKDSGESIKYAQDSSKSPPHFDVTHTYIVTMGGSNVKPKTEKRSELIRGVYEIRGDTLTICLATKQATPRPENVAPKNREGFEIMVLKRVK